MRVGLNYAKVLEEAGLKGMYSRKRERGVRNVSGLLRAVGGWTREMRVYVSRRWGGGTT